MFMVDLSWSMEIHGVMKQLIAGGHHILDYQQLTWRTNDHSKMWFNVDQNRLVKYSKSMPCRPCPRHGTKTPWLGQKKAPSPFMNFGWTALISGDFFSCVIISRMNPQISIEHVQAVFFYVERKDPNKPRNSDGFLVNLSFFSGFTAWTSVVPTEVWHS